MENKKECDCYYTKFCKSTHLDDKTYCRDSDTPNIQTQETWDDIIKGFIKDTSGAAVELLKRHLKQNYQVPKPLK